jgi:hypothetical protein
LISSPLFKNCRWACAKISERHSASDIMEGIVENITPFMMNWDELNKLCKANGVKPMRRRKSVMVDALRAADKLPPGFAGCWQDEEYEEEHADDQESDDDDEPDDDKEEKVDDEEEKVDDEEEKGDDEEEKGDDEEESVDDEEESERLWAVKNNSRLKSKRRGTTAKARHLAVVAATNATPGPRKLVTLHNLNPSEIILCGMKLKSREAVELLIAERYEAAGKFLSFKGNVQAKRFDRVAPMCNCGDGDCGRVIFNAQADTEWICASVVPFRCDGPAKPTRSSGTTAYSVAMLADVVRSTVAQDPKTKAAAIAAVHTLCLCLCS